MTRYVHERLLLFYNLTFIQVCKILVENGANNSKTMHNKEGKIPLDLARKYEVRVIVSPPQDFGKFIFHLFDQKGDDEELDMEDADSD